MKTFGGSLALLSSLSLVAIGCGQDQADDLNTTDDALITCGGWHHGGADNHRGHHHNRHHHGHGGTGGSRPHLTGAGGTSGGMMGGTSGGMMGGTSGGYGRNERRMAGTTGSAGTSGDMGGSGGAMVDPRCAPMDGMISWWHGDDDYDDAVGSNDGLTAGGVTFAPGIDHDGFNFNGTTGSFVEVPDDATLSPSESRLTRGSTRPYLAAASSTRSPFGNDGYMMDISSIACVCSSATIRCCRPCRYQRGCWCMSRWSTPAPASSSTSTACWPRIMRAPSPPAGQQPSAAHRRGRRRRQPVHGRDRRATDLRARPLGRRDPDAVLAGQQLPVGRNRRPTLTTICRRLPGRRGAGAPAGIESRTMSTGSPVCARTVFPAVVAVAGGVRLLVALADYRSLSRQRRLPRRRVLLPADRAEPGRRPRHDVRRPTAHVHQ